jgi:hypothetical protein
VRNEMREVEEKGECGLRCIIFVMEAGGSVDIEGLA